MSRQPTSQSSFDPLHRGFSQCVVQVIHNVAVDVLYMCTVVTSQWRTSECIGKLPVYMHTQILVHKMCSTKLKVSRVIKCAKHSRAVWKSLPDWNDTKFSTCQYCIFTHAVPSTRNVALTTYSQLIKCWLNRCSTCFAREYSPCEKHCEYLQMKPTPRRSN